MERTYLILEKSLSRYDLNRLQGGAGLLVEAGAFLLAAGEAGLGWSFRSLVLLSLVTNLSALCTGAAVSRTGAACEEEGATGDFTHSELRADLTFFCASILNLEPEGPIGVEVGVLSTVAVVV